MADNSRWVGDFEITVLAHLLNTPVYSFQRDNDNNWLPCFPHGIDRRIPAHVSAPSMHIFFRSVHFQVVTAVRQHLAS